jgi:hypothetical protein
MIALKDQRFRAWLGEYLEFLDDVLTEVCRILISPAQGAMFAPLALKFVLSRPTCSMSDWRPLLEPLSSK